MHPARGTLALLPPVLPWWEVQEVGRGNVPLLHWVGRKRRPSGSQRAFPDHLLAVETGPHHLLCTTRTHLPSMKSSLHIHRLPLRYTQE